jgi:hypothetical protein
MINNELWHNYKFSVDMYDYNFQITPQPLRNTVTFSLHNSYDKMYLLCFASTRRHLAIFNLQCLGQAADAMCDGRIRNLATPSSFQARQ